MQLLDRKLEAVFIYLFFVISTVSFDCCISVCIKNKIISFSKREGLGGGAKMVV